jgi:hypothetical protein
VALSHLDLVNVALALRLRQPGWPACLADHGYVVYAIGVTIRMPSREISPDVLVSATQPSWTLLFEIKSGSQVDLSQLQRMEQTTGAELKHYAYLPIADPD